MIYRKAEPRPGKKKLSFILHARAVISVFIFVLYMPLFKTTSRLSKAVVERTLNSEMHDRAVLIG